MADRAGTGFVDILPRLNPASFNAALGSQLRPALDASGKSFASKISSGVKSLSAAVGAPVGALAVGTGIAAIGKLTIGFEDSFTRISALSNASASDIAKWRDQVLTLSGETAQAPQELADALFFLSSAGLKSTDVFPALEVSAKAAATGLGSTADVANIVASALNAYAGSGLKAVDVTDTLVAAVREGRAEPDAFADALGRILPIASAAGVGFDEVTASLAALSNIGLDVNEGVTAMRGLLQAIVAPGSQAADTLAGLGISTDELRKTLSQGGLPAALALLERATGGNIDTLRKIIPNIRSLTGELGLTGKNADQVASIFDRVANASGSLGEAFGTTAQGPGFQFRQLLTEIQNLLLAVGETVLPIATKFVSVFETILAPITDVVTWLGKVPGVTDAIGVALAGLLAVKAVNFFTDLTKSVIANITATETLTGVQTTNWGVAKVQATTNRVLTGTNWGLTASAEAATVAIEGEAVATKGLGLASIGLAGKIRGLGAAAAAAAPEIGLAFAAESGAPKIAEVAIARAQATLDFSNQAIDSFLSRIDPVTDHVKKFREEAVRSGEGIGAAGQKFIAFADTLGGDGRAKLIEWHEAVKASTEDNAEAVRDFLNSIEEDWKDFQQEAAEGLDFIPDRLQEIEADGKVTAGGVLTAFKKARQDTREFGQDLLKISRTGGQAGKDLAASFLAAGDTIAADAVAGAPKKLRDNIIDMSAKSRSAADDLATKLTDSIVGPLEHIEDILFAIAKSWNIRLPVSVTGDTAELASLVNNLAKLRTVAGVHGGGGGTGAGRFDVSIGIEGGALGGVTRGASGFLTRGPVFQIGEAGTELVDPLESPRATRLRAQSIAEALKLLGVGGHGGDMRVHVTVGIDDSGNLQVRRIAQDEVQREARYRDRVPA